MANLIVRTGTLTSDKSRGGRIILRGELDICSSIAAIKTDWYQRKASFSQQKTNQLMKDLAAGDEFPDITLGMRGDQYVTDRDDTVNLCDPVYIIDGLQRWTAAWLVFENNPQTQMRLGVKVFFNSTPEFEQEQFRLLNTRHSSMSANVILRNEKERNRVAGTLYGLTCNEPRFALFERVCWDQVMARQNGGDLLVGTTLLNVMIELHRHLTGGVYAASVICRVDAMDQKMLRAGLSLQRARDNVILFFDFVDAAWGVRTPGLTIKAAPYLYAGWLMTIAKILSDHDEFWRNDDELFVSLPFIRDFKKIDPSDDEMRRLAGGNAHTRVILYNTIVDRLNKGKSSNRLVNRATRQKLREESHG